MKICNKCFMSYKEDIALLKEIERVDFGSENGYREYKECILRECDGEIIDVDDLMATIIITLNIKGYNTISCCSGHVEDGEKAYTYIHFEKGVQFDIVPDGFELLAIKEQDSKTEEYIIGISYEETDDILEMYEQVMDNNSILLQWALELKDLEDEPTLSPDPNNKIIPFTKK